MTVAIDLPAAPSAAAPQAEGSSIHPFFHAGKWIVSDMLSTMIFVAIYAATHSVYAAIGLAIAGGIGQIAYLRVRGRPVDTMQWLSLGLVTVFGGASLITHDPRFVMFKPTLIYLVVGAVMLKPGWITRYMPPIALQWGRDVVTAFGYVWAAMMFATAALNLVVVLYADTRSWAWFIGVFPLASKLGLFGVQYLVTRLIVRGRIRAAA